MMLAVSIVASCALVGLLIVAMLFLRNQMIEKDRVAKYEHEKLIIDLFKFQIQNPKMCFDVEGADLLNEQKKLMVLYTLSIFDLVIDYYFSKRYTVRDSAMKEAWLNTISDYFALHEIVTIFKENQRQFNRRFQNFVSMNYLEVKDGNNE